MNKLSFLFSIWILVGGMLLLATTLPGQSRDEVEAFRAEVEKIFEKRDVSCLKSSVEGYISIWDEKAIRIVSDKPTVFGISVISDN